MALPLSGSSLLIKISARPHSYVRLAAAISNYFTQIAYVKGIKTEDLSFHVSSTISRISSVGRALDCRVGSRGFNFRDWTNTQGLKITEK